MRARSFRKTIQTLLNTAEYLCEHQAARNQKEAQLASLLPETNPLTEFASQSSLASTKSHDAPIGIHTRHAEVIKWKLSFRLRPEKEAPPHIHPNRRHRKARPKLQSCCSGACPAELSHGRTCRGGTSRIQNRCWPGPIPSQHRCSQSRTPATILAV